MSDEVTSSHPREQASTAPSGADDGGPEASERFTEADVATYLELADFVVPDRERVVELIGDLIPRRREPFHVLDLGCGDGILAETVVQRFPEVTVHGIDASPSMLKRARARMAFCGSRFYGHRFELASVGWRRISAKVGAVVSMLALHHLTGPEKRELFRDVHRLLLPRGAFLVADLVEPPDVEGRSVAAREWDRHVFERSLHYTGDTEAYQRFREERWNHFVHPDGVDRPSPLYDQLKWLEEVGFRRPDVFWMKAGHALFGAVKGAG